MKTNRERKVVAQIAGRGLMLAALLASMISAAAFCRAQASAAPSPNQGSKVGPAFAPATPGANAVAAPKPQATAAKGSRDAVTVHGYWVIDIRNADGTVAKHMEFENQLCTSPIFDGFGGGGVGGDSILSSLLQGSASVGAWSILVGIPDASGLTQPNCAIAPFAYSTQQNAMAAGGLYGIPNSVNGQSFGNVFGFPLAMSCRFSNPNGSFITFPGSNNITNHCANALTESPAPSGVGITLAAQFNQPTNVQISAVGTELFTCTGTPGPPRPTDCLNIGQDAANLQNTANNPCQIQGTGAISNVSLVNFTGCIPGDTTSTVTISSETVSNIPGRAPFSGVILTGTNGVPGPFSIAPGQTAAVTWTLSFQ